MENTKLLLLFVGSFYAKYLFLQEMLEHTLFGMKNKILDHQDRPAELQKLRKQQKMIEKELVRVKRLLNSSAKVGF